MNSWFENTHTFHHCSSQHVCGCGTVIDCAVIHLLIFEAAQHLQIFIHLSSGIMRDAAEPRYSIHVGTGDLFQFPVAAALPPGVSGYLNQSRWLRR